MTLIAALRCRDGLILGSDSQAAYGTRGRRIGGTTPKVYPLRHGFMLAWAGAQDVAQEFALRVERHREISTAVDRLETKKRLLHTLAKVREDPSVNDRSDSVEFLVGWWSRGSRKPVALRILSGGRSEWVSGWCFGGLQLGIEGAAFAVGSMSYIDFDALTLEQAKVVALKVLRDTIATTVDGIGGPVQLGTVQARGAKVLSPADMRGLHDTVDVWESRCAELLVGGASPPSASATPDKGVRPPARAGSRPAV